MSRERQLDKLIILAVVISCLLPLVQSVITIRVTNPIAHMVSDTEHLLVTYHFYTPIIPAIFIIFGIDVLRRKPKPIIYAGVYFAISAITTILLNIYTGYRILIDLYGF